MNKYLFRGLVFVVIGGAIGVWSVYLQKQELSYFRWFMISAVILFGIGFLLVIYSLIRKIERRSILDERANTKKGIK